MSNSITISCSIPLELSIKIEEHMELRGYNRSELIKLALNFYMDQENHKKQSSELIEEIHKNVLSLMKNAKTLSNK